ncbi:MAG: TOBE domain-containing protein [Elusimicrobia bacterium]|nr:TOBE domain-containing protein [Elusimicrobiota bacterium]
MGKSVLLRHPSFDLAVPLSLTAQVAPLAGKKLIFGIRPEDLYDRLFYNYPVAPGSSVKATVDVVEPLGPEIILYLKAGAVDLVARVPGYVKAQEGKKWTLFLTWNGCTFLTLKQKGTLEPGFENLCPPRLLRLRKFRLYKPVRLPFSLP